MAKRKPTPEKSKIERVPPLAYSRRQKGADGGGEKAGEPKAETKPETPEAADPAKPEATHEPVMAEEPPHAGPAKPELGPEPVKAEHSPQIEAAKPEPKLEPVTAEEPPQSDAQVIDPPPPKGEPWPDATPPPMRPVEAPARARTETMSMPPTAAVGAPPAVPGTVEDPTLMPGPREVPGGDVTDAALPPGRVPSGDSRSLRKDAEFALIYRIGTAVITRFGIAGQRGQWRVVEYPTPASASSSFAKEVSRFVGEGFSDYRD